ncbi:MAG: hypothetical protein ACTSRS_09710 [Candidatus Helarchaeota archaeon]
MNVRERHITELVRVISDIVGGQRSVLQKIERGLVEYNKANIAIIKKLNLIDQKIQGGFNILENTKLTALESKVTEGLERIDITFLRKVERDLDDIKAKLQQQINAQLLHVLIKQSMKQKKPEPSDIRRARPISPLVTPRRAPIHAVTAPVPKSAAAEAASAEAVEVPEGEWQESELEGAKIFDTIIVGWKRRDWEKVKGTKEIFMRGWKKLSSSDKQKIRNGAWSKPIMNKIKLLGRN